MTYWGDEKTSSRFSIINATITMSTFLSAHRSSVALLAVVAAALMVLPVQAQDTGTISGTVIDAQNGETLPGANISIVGTERGTATNAQGQYTLSNVQPGMYSVRASFVGFQPQVREQVQVTAGEETQLDFELRASQQTLEEVVVVGYGEQEQGDVTGSYAQVDSATFNQGSVASPEQLISGKVAGLQITTSGGAPGASSQIRIRGASSVNADSSPLFVVDGVPISNEGNQASRNPLNFLNPSDIESINVLKDASATAIYGARGSNGVIIIETTSASEGTSRITYNGSVSSSSVIDRIDVLGPDQFRRAVAEEAPGQLGRLGDARTDWQEQVERTALTQEHNVSFARGYEDSDIRLSLSYRDEEGTLQTSEMQRIGASLKYNQEFLDDDLSLRTSLRGSKIDNRFEPGLVGAAASMAPTQPIRDPGSSFGGFFEWPEGFATGNPVASYVYTQNTGETYRSLGSIEGEYRVPFLQGLSARVKLGYDVQEGEREFFAPGDLKAYAAPNPGRIERRNFSRINTLLDAFLSFDREFDSISSEFDVTAGYSWQEFHAEFPEFTATGLFTDVLGPNSLRPVTSTENIGGFITETPNRLISGFGRLNYTFQDRYILKLTVRRDGSSRFGPENQWGTFPSASLGWRVDRESFLEGVDLLSNLKLRASWGQTGNQEIGDFLYANFVVPSNSTARYQFGEEFVSTLRPSPADPSLKWEQTTTYNVGLDYGILDGRVTGSVEWYLKKTDDLLFNVPIPGGSNLSDRVTTNIGSMENTGVEFNVNAQVVEGETFSYNAGLNAATNSNELTDVPRVGGEGGIPTGAVSGGLGNTIQTIREGHPINSFLVYRHKENENGEPRTDGVDHNGDGVVNQVDMYVDQNEDGVINSSDLVVGESPQPDWTFGHTSRMTYGNFDASFTLRAEVGNHVYNNVASNFGRYDRLSSFAPSNLHESVLTTEFNGPQQLSDYYVEDASYLRVDNISLGYRIEAIPGVNSVRVYGTVRNAFVLTGYNGPDPEVSNGIDDTLYPRSRTFTTGLNVRL